MAYCSSYYLYQRYEKRGDQDWIPSYPNVYSIDGEGSKPLRARQMYDTDCGWIPDTEPIYRWTEITPTSDPSTYWCDDCSSEYSGQYLTFVAVDSGTFTTPKNVYYSLDSGSSWTYLAASATTPTIASGNKIMWKQTGNNFNEPFSSTGRFNVEGNIMSLLYGDDFADKTSLEGKRYSLGWLFFECSDLISAENLVLPATTLEYCCYCRMFYGCTSLTSVPQLPSTTLAEMCYTGMFYGCSSLATVPSNYLPSTTLAEMCYTDMFSGCTSLETLPALPATTLAEKCYQSMFAGCTSLITVPSNLLPATTLTDDCYSHMFESCTGLTSTPALPATTIAVGCYGWMFSGCTSLETLPALPATTLANSCYEGMFCRCTSLTNVSSNYLPVTTLAYDCYAYMFCRCTSLTTAPDLPATTLAGWCYHSMFRECSSLNYVKCLATDISATDCTNYWLSGVSSSGTFVKNSSMSSWSSGSDGIPSNWTIQNA